jgi:hypothetical protein
MTSCRLLRGDREASENEDMDRQYEGAAHGTTDTDQCQRILSKAFDPRIV